jgi:hypothetical protein
MPPLIQKIKDLIQHYDSTFPRNSNVQVGTIVNQLEQLIEEEEAHLEKMAEYFEQQETWNESREVYSQVKLFD